MPAVPEPLDRRLAFGADGALYVVGRRRRELQLRRLRPGRQPAEPVRRSARSRRRGADAADGRGRRAPQPGRPRDDPATIPRSARSTARSCGSTRRPARRCRTTRSPSSTDANARRIVAYGLRNPFRFTVRPGTNELWIGDVGWNTWEEINRIVDADAARSRTSAGRATRASAGRAGYDGANLNICESLYAAGRARSPPVLHLQPQRARSWPARRARPAARRSPGSRSTQRRHLPGAYDGALFFADYSRNCIWVMLAGANGLPDPDDRRRSSPARPDPVDLEIGPGGDLFYVDFNGGTIRRISYFAANQPPTASHHARRPTSGAAPLTGQLRRHAARATRTAATAHLRLGPRRRRRVRRLDAADRDLHLHAAGQLHGAAAGDRRRGAPRRRARRSRSRAEQHAADARSIDTPAAGTTWTVGDTITFSGHATDAQQGTLPASALSWSARPAALPVRLPRAPAPDVHRRGARARSSRPTTSTRPTSSCGSPPPTPAGSPTPRRVRLDPQTVALTLRVEPVGPAARRRRDRARPRRSPAP